MHTPLKVVVIIATLLAMPAWAGAKNHFECVLEKMPGVKSDSEANAIWKACLKAHGSPREVKLGSGRGWFGYDSGTECADDKAGETDSQAGVTMITTACNRLYDDPKGPKTVKNPEERGIKFGDLLQ